MNLGDWALTVLVGIVVGSLSGVGLAMMWFRASRVSIYMRLDAMDELIKERLNVMQVDTDRRHDKTEQRLHEMYKTDTAHEVQLSVLTTCQANIASTLVDLKQGMRDQDVKLDAILRGRSE